MLNLIKVFRVNLLSENKKDFILADFLEGTLAQLVEQRTENPCVPGSIPGGTTLQILDPDFSSRIFGFITLGFINCVLTNIK